MNGISKIEEILERLFSYNIFLGIAFLLIIVFCGLPILLGIPILILYQVGTPPIVALPLVLSFNYYFLIKKVW